MSYLPTAIAESVAISIEETKYKDFYFDEESGQFTGQVVEGVQALKGWIYFALRIARYKYPIFSWKYGTELETFIGQSFEQGTKDGINIGTIMSTIQMLSNSIGASIDGQELKPKITPILDLDNPDFVSGFNRVREMFGYNPTMQVNSTLDTSLNLADAVKIPEQKDYASQFERIIDLLGITSIGVNNFNDSMSHMRFSVNGEEFGMLIHPFISRAAGYDSVTFARQGVDEGTE